MVLQKVLRDEPIPPRRFSDRIPRNLQTVCLKAMAKDPERRYRTALEFRDDLQRWLNGETIHARPVSRVERGWRWCRRNPLPASLVAAVALLLVLGTVGSVLMARHDRSLRSNAEQAKHTAEDNARESHERLVRQYVRQGMGLVDQGDLLTALPWFAEALRIDDEHPERRKLHRIRLAATIRQCPKLLQVWSGQSRLHRATMSPNGRHVAVGYEDGTAELCNVETGTRAALKSSGPVIALAFSPDSRLLLAATSTGATRLWDVSTGLAVIDLEHDVGVAGAAFARDGAKFLTLCRDQHVRVWDVAGRKLVVELAHGAAVAYAGFSPDGTQVVTACADQMVRVWNAATGECSATLKHSSYVNRVEFSSDGRRIPAACGGFMQAGEARVWDLDADPPKPLLLPHPEACGWHASAPMAVAC